jgi:hypothetical protein
MINDSLVIWFMDKRNNHVYDEEDLMVVLWHLEELNICTRISNTYYI